MQVFCKPRRFRKKTHFSGCHVQGLCCWHFCSKELVFISESLFELCKSIPLQGRHNQMLAAHPSLSDSGSSRTAPEAAPQNFLQSLFSPYSPSSLCVVCEGEVSLRMCVDAHRRAYFCTKYVHPCIHGSLKTLIFTHMHMHAYISVYMRYARGCWR